MRKLLFVCFYTNAWRIGDLSRASSPPTLIESTSANGIAHNYLSHRKLDFQGFKASPDFDMWPPRRVRYTPPSVINKVKLAIENHGVIQTSDLEGQQLPSVIFTMSQLQFLMGVFGIDPPKLLFTFVKDMSEMRHLGIYRDIASLYKNIPVYGKIYEFVIRLMHHRAIHGSHSVKPSPTIPSTTTQPHTITTPLPEPGTNDTTTSTSTSTTNSRNTAPVSKAGLGFTDNTPEGNLESTSDNKYFVDMEKITETKVFNREKPPLNFDNSSVPIVGQAMRQMSTQQIDLDAVFKPKKEFVSKIESFLRKEPFLEGLVAKNHGKLDPAGLNDVLSMYHAAVALVRSEEAPTNSVDLENWLDKITQELPEGNTHQAEHHNLCDWYKPPLSCYHRMSQKCLSESVRRWQGHPRDSDIFPRLSVGHVALPRNPFRALQALIDVACNPWIKELHGDVMLYSTDQRQYGRGLRRWDTTTSTRTPDEKKKNDGIDQYKPSDPELKAQWYIKDLKILEAWALTKGDPNVVTMVVDTGCQPDHPDLKDNYWNNPNPGRGIYQNDYNGINVVDENGDFSDQGAHGTHMSGIVAATTDNNQGVAGVGFGSKLFCCKFLTGSSGVLSDVNKCMDYAMDHGIRIISLSVGGNAGFPTTEQVMRKASEHGLFVSTTAGDQGDDNDNNPQYPAQYASEPGMAVISVGGYAENGTLINFGNYGRNSVETAGPGDYVFATAINSGYEYRGGTSPATPVIAGIAALVMSANSKLTGLEVKEIIKDTIDPMDDEWRNKIKWGGKPNAYEAVKKALEK